MITPSSVPGSRPSRTPLADTLFRRNLPPLRRNQAVYVALQGETGPLHICAASVGQVSPLALIIPLFDEQCEQVIRQAVPIGITALREQPGHPTGYQPSGVLQAGEWCLPEQLKEPQC